MKSVLKNFIFLIVLSILLSFGGGKAHSDVQVNLPDTSAEHGDTIAIPMVVSDVTGEENMPSRQS